VQNEDHVVAASDDYYDPVGKGANTVTSTTLARYAVRTNTPRLHKGSSANWQCI